jgi:hypothetical protein
MDVSIAVMARAAAWPRRAMQDFGGVWNAWVQKASRGCNPAKGANPLSQIETCNLMLIETTISRGQGK